MIRVAAMVIVGGALSVALSEHSKSPEMVIHEWGTITTRHAPNGTPQGSMNRIGDRERLPNFVVQYAAGITNNDPTKSLIKSAVADGRSDVTMRLETPVLYFHPQPGARVAPFDVRVLFRGGVVNEFYPNGAASVVVDPTRVASTTMARPADWDGKVLDSLVAGSLKWHVQLDDAARGPRTDSHVWLAPRAVKSTPVSVNGQGEQYLFYRGVAHIVAPLQTRLSPAEVRLLAPAGVAWLRSTATIDRSWLIDVRPTGDVAFREQGPITISRAEPSREVARIARFAEHDYSKAAQAQLRASMKSALVAAGLFDDEADAMLETWNVSYFKDPGLRLFYLVPQEWTAYHLPLEISTPNKLTRVIVGRIDLPER